MTATALRVHSTQKQNFPGTPEIWEGGGIRDGRAAAFQEDTMLAKLSLVLPLGFPGNMWQYWGGGRGEYLSSGIYLVGRPGMLLNILLIKCTGQLPNPQQINDCVLTQLCPTFATPWTY